MKRDRRRLGRTGPLHANLVSALRIVGGVQRLVHVADQVPDPMLRSLIARARALPLARIEAPPGQWLAESNQLAREVALDYPQFSCNAPPTGTVVLSRGYQRRAQRVISAQLALAGARLAAAVNRALDPR